MWSPQPSDLSLCPPPHHLLLVERRTDRQTEEQLVSGTKSAKLKTQGLLHDTLTSDRYHFWLTYSGSLKSALLRCNFELLELSSEKFVSYVERPSIGKALEYKISS